jgi:hypothetical protein
MEVDGGSAKDKTFKSGRSCISGHSLVDNYSPICKKVIMKQLLKWSLAAIALLTFAIGMFVFLTEPLDSCLDSGGCWDSLDKVCRKTEANAQELCDRPF